MSESQQSLELDVLLAIGRDLTASLAAEDRYARLLDAICRAIPCDAACLLRYEGDVLIPLAGRGLRAEALARCYSLREHPRFDVILRSSEPVRFAPDSPLPDPFDGHLTMKPGESAPVHACLGCALTEGNEVVGALTVDALAADAFGRIDTRFLATVAALAGAALRTSVLVDALERRAEHRRHVARELQRTAELASGGQILGTSAAVHRLLQEIRIVGGSDLAALITGETGVGKELVARAVHAASSRRDEALIHVNCAALPESIAESELFGHVSGAFTGAVRDRPGKFEAAHGGTLFLDEIGEMPLTIQPKLLRALQHGEVQRVGSDRVLRVDVRVIAATNRDLEREVERGRFRADLFHRLAAFPLHVPSLRQRREDIPLLAAHFADVARRRLGTGPVRITSEARARLEAADWPGNVRELENVIERGVLRAAFGLRPGDPVKIDLDHIDLPDAPRASFEPAAEAPVVGTLRERVERFQLSVIREAVERRGGSWAAAARDLGMHRSNLHHLAARLGLLGAARSEPPPAEDGEPARRRERR
ncbi:MAG TPA: nitric oxide reductase transcriptional regulator NorR [Polyangiaceae bacterium]|nr:nitric oxide reductase transcriptional regulator NorR [Polyangiaceae bacterium]